MSFAIARKIAGRELRGGLKGFRVFLTCLALGVAAIAAVGTVRDSIEAGLAQEGATLLGGDASIGLTYRFASEEERAWMEANAMAVSEIVDFRSMAVVDRDGENERGLTQVKSVDDAYPIYGEIELEPNLAIDDAFAVEDGVPGAIMDRVLVDRLGLNIGDIFALGTQNFRLNAMLTREPDNGGGGFGLGPRTLVRTDALAASGLLQPGTLFDTEYRLELPENADFEGLKSSAVSSLPDAGLRWRDKRNGTPGVSEFVDRLSAFLVLVGLAGLAVGGVGVSAAVRSYMAEKTSVIAILKTLGATRRTVFQSYFLQIGALTILGVTVGLALGAGVPLVFGPLIEARLPLPIALGVKVGPLFEAGLYGILAAGVFTLWPLARAEDVRPASLFRDVSRRGARFPRFVWIATTGLLLAGLIGSAAYFSGVATLTFWAAGGITAAFVLLVFMSLILRFAARRLARSRLIRGRPSLRLALASIGGPGADATSAVLSLGLGLAVLAAIGQIDTNLRGAIDRDLPEVAPSYFIVDIQNDQMPGFRSQMDENEAVTKVQSAPMLRGIISEINGRPASETAGDHWVLQGDRGITYSDAPPDGTVITDGAWWPNDHTGAAEISFSAEEGTEMGLMLGDMLTINVLGRDIEAKITSFREVDFSTAGIGFILSMTPSALAGAPHTHIATVYADAEAESQILRDLANAYPNITAIRVKDAIDRVSDVLAGIASAVTYGALASLVTGIVVLIGTAAASEQSRTYEASVLKTLGASRRFILWNFALRSAVLGAAAGCVAVGAGALAGWGVSRFVMETDFVFNVGSAVVIIIGGILATVLAGAVFAWRPLSARPAQILRARE